MFPLETTPIDTATWRKSTFSHPNLGCVDIARPPGPVVGIRDWKSPTTGRLVLPVAGFRSFLAFATA